MGNENSTTDHQKSSSASSPRSVQPSGDSQSLWREQAFQEAPRSPDLDLQRASSAGLLGSRAASGNTASLDRCIQSSEATERRKHAQETGGAEGSPPPRSALPREQARPSASMPFTECSPEGGLASPAAGQEDGALAQQPKKDPQPGGPGELGAAATPARAGFPPHCTAPVAPGAACHTRSSGTDQWPGISPGPPGESCGQSDQPDGFKSQGKEGAGGCAPPEGSTCHPVATHLNKGSSDEITVPQGPVLRASDGGLCQGEASPQGWADNLEFPRACHPPSKDSGVDHHAKANTATQDRCQQRVGAHEPPTELLHHPPCPAVALRGTDAQSHSQTGSPGAESHPLVRVPAGSQPGSGSLLAGTESAPLTQTEEAGPAPSPTAHPGAPSSATTGEPRWLARETVAEMAAPVSADSSPELVQGGLLGALGGEHGRPEGSHRQVPVQNPQEQGEPWKTEQSHAVSQETPRPPAHLGASSETSRRSVGSKDRAKASEDAEHPTVAREEGGSSGETRRGQEDATETRGGVDQVNAEEEAPQAGVGKPNPQRGQEEVSKPGSEGENRTPARSGSAQPSRNGHEASADSQSAEAPWPPMAESHVADVAAPLHKLPEEDPTLPLAPDGCGEHVVPKRPRGGESLLPAPGQPSRLEHHGAGQDIQVDRSPPCDRENSAVDGSLTMFRVGQECQRAASCAGSSQTRGAAEIPLQPSPLDPEASIVDALREEAQPLANEKEAHPGNPDDKSQGVHPSPSHAPMEPQRDARLPAHGGQDLASRLEHQHEAPKGSQSDAPTPSKQPESTPTGQEWPVLGENRQKGAGNGAELVSVSPATADTLKDASLAENLGGEESCYTGQRLNKSQQELVDAMKTGSRHEDAGPMGPPPPGVGETETASGNTMEAPPCPPDSVVFQDAAHCLPVPEPTSLSIAPPRGAPEKEARGETQEDRRQPVPAPQRETECPAVADAGDSPAAQDQDGAVRAAETWENSRPGGPGMQQAPEGPAAALRGDFIQEEHGFPSGAESPTSDPGEPCRAEQLTPGCQDALLPAGEPGGIPRSTGESSARGTVTDSKRLLAWGPPEGTGPDLLYLRMDGAARKEAEDDGAQAISTKGPCHTEESLLSAGSFDSLLHPGSASGGHSGVPAGSGSPKAGLPLLAEGEQTSEEEQVPAAPEVDARLCGSAAGPVREVSTAGEVVQATEHSKDRMVQASSDARKGASGSVGPGSKQTRVIAGLPDFREHITKIFEQSVLATPAAERSQSEKTGAGRRTVGKDLTRPPSPEKLLEGTKGVAVAPLPEPPAGLWVEKKHKLAVEAEPFHLISEGAALDEPPGPMGPAVAQNLPDACVEERVTRVPPRERSEGPEGSGEAGPGVQAPLSPGRGEQKSASGHSSPGQDRGVPAGSTHDFRVSPRILGEEELVLSGKESLEILARHREDAVLDCALPGGVPGSTCALKASSTCGDASIVPTAKRDPRSPDALGGERKPEAAAGTTSVHCAPGTVSGSPPEASKATGAAGGAQGGVTLSTAGTQARASGVLPETAPARLLPGVAPDSAPPGSCQDPACSDQTEPMEGAAASQGDSPAGHPKTRGQPGPELPAPAGPGKAQVLVPEELNTDRKNPGSVPATFPLTPEKDVPRVPSDEARGVGGPARGSKVNPVQGLYYLETVRRPAPTES